MALLVHIRSPWNLRTWVWKPLPSKIIGIKLWRGHFHSFISNASHKHPYDVFEVEGLLGNLLATKSFKNEKEAKVDPYLTKSVPLKITFLLKESIFVDFESKFDLMPFWLKRSQSNFRSDSNISWQTIISENPIQTRGKSSQGNSEYSREIWLFKFCTLHQWEIQILSRTFLIHIF